MSLLINDATNLILRHTRVSLLSIKNLQIYDIFHLFITSICFGSNTMTIDITITCPIRRNVVT